MTFRKGTKLVCVHKPKTRRGAGYEITVGRTYQAAEDSYTYDDREIVELVENDAGEPCTYYETECFTQTRTRR